MQLKISLIFSIILLSYHAFSQDTLVLQPDSFCGQDAYIWQLSNQNGEYGTTEDNNYGTSRSFIAQEWTWNGDPGRRRSLINFDFSQIPEGAIILDARLDLYGFPDSPDNGHASLTGSNQAVLKRITSSWEENTVTWNTQPTTTSINQVFLSESVSVGQDYLSIDMKDLCQDIVNDPFGSAGMMFSILEPSHYRAMIFASSDHTDPSKHPRLRVIYLPTSASENNAFNNFTDTTICKNESFVYNAFRPCASYNWSTGSISSEETMNDSGIYWVKVTTNAATYIDTFQVTKIDCSYILELPNVFTPNADHINDIFIPVKSKGVVSMKTTILNPWGQVVYQTSDPSILWDGHLENGSTCTDGVYFWLIEFTTLYGTEESIHGKVTLLR